MQDTPHKAASDERSLSQRLNGDTHNNTLADKGYTTSPKQSQTDFGVLKIKLAKS
ncbi:MAG: hypothetical protein K5978_03660 [Campylobacter sp.]|nr:hypothetical protein [Campylobacter sp.]